ncbi:MAG: AP endonuclease [Pseudomonadota bacterium]
MRYASKVGFVARFLVALAVVAGSIGPAAAQKRPAAPSLFSQENAMAWCIVPYDSQQRTPAQRIAMLKTLGFSQYAYDWRPKHLDSFGEELRLAKENGIAVAAVWIWIDQQYDKLGKLSANNQRMLDILKASGMRTRIWVGFNGNFFENLDENAKIDKGVAMLRFLRQKVPANVTGLGLYNHGDWFGEPENQIKILKVLKDRRVGLVYNFHHAHEQLDRFPAMLAQMRPWLWTVNLSGLRKGGPKIMPLGSGDRELDMMRLVQDSGFKGTIGVLGHIEEEDVQQVLQRNLDGLRKLEQQL